MKTFWASTGVFLSSLVLPCYAQTNTNDVVMPPDPRTEENIYVDTNNITYAFVYDVEVVTNADLKVYAIYKANVTNYVERYPKLLYVQVTTRTSMTNEWSDLGEPLIFKLGDFQQGFYSAKVWIE